MVPVLCDGDSENITACVDDRRMGEYENMTSDNNQQDASSCPHWQVEIDVAKCSLCEVCTRHCPPGALRSEQSGDTLFIMFKPELCDGCQACLEHCPEDAVRLVRADAPPGKEESILVKSQMLRCSVCGTYFAPVSKLEAASRKKEDDLELISEQCPLCRRTQMVASFIDEKRKVSGRKAEYRTGKKWNFKPVVEGDPDGPPCPEILEKPLKQAPPFPGQDKPAASQEEGKG